MSKNSAESPLRLDNIGQIAITASDLRQSKDFYREILGLQFLFDAGPMSFFQCGGIRLAIGTSADPPDRGGTILYFRVSDIHKTHKLLAGRGVEFLRKPHRVAQMADHDLWMAFFHDPDNRPIGLMCELPRTVAANP